MMKDVHEAATQFLRDYKAGRGTYQYEDITTNAIEMSSLIVLRREQQPRYFCGFKPSGAAVFSYDVKIAKVFNAGCATVENHIAKLSLAGHDVKYEPTIWREGQLAK